MSRNPFGVPDVSDPVGEDVLAFASDTRMHTDPENENSQAWDRAFDATPVLLEGNWSSRWNAEGIDWKRGHASLHVDEEQIYILFDWDDGASSGLLEARWNGQNQLVGRYQNLGNRRITRPWVGRIVDAARIDGVHTGGRLDFSRELTTSV